MLAIISSTQNILTSSPWLLAQKQLSITRLIRFNQFDQINYYYYFQLCISFHSWHKWFLEFSCYNVWCRMVLSLFNLHQFNQFFVVNSYWKHAGSLGWVVSVVCPPGVFLWMFEIPLGNFMSSRDKNFPVGNFCSRVASQIIYIAKKNNRPIFSLDKSTQEIQRKKQRWWSE